MRKQLIGALVLCLGITVNAFAATNLGTFTKYVDRPSGLTFQYPADAKVTENPDKDSAVKFEGATNGVGYSFSLQNTDLALGTDPSSAMKLLSQHALAKLPNARAFHSESIRIGGSATAGAATAASFDAGAVRARMKLVVFRDPKNPGRVRVLAFSAAESDFEKTDPLIAHILQSIGSSSGADDATTHGAIGSDNSKTSAEPAVETYSSPAVSFDYPKGWIAHEWAGKEVDISSTGNSAGAGQLHMSWFPTNGGYTPEQLAAMVESEHLGKLPNYKKHLETTQTCGRKHDVTGLRHSYSATADQMTNSIQVFVFQHNNYLYCLSLMQAGADPTSALKQFDRVLASITLK